MPFEIIRNTTCWFLSDLFCSFYFKLSFIITFASVVDIVLISVDRYLAVCDPLHYSTKVTEKTVKVCVCLSWLYSVFYGSLIVKNDFTKPGRQSLGQCIMIVDYVSGTIDLVVSFVVPVLVIIVLYMRVFIVAVSQARIMQAHITAVTLQFSLTHTSKKSELKAAKTLGVLVIVFLICFCPYHCVSFAGNGSFSTFSLFLLYFNSTLNPVIYALFYPWFRKAVKVIITFQILQPDSREVNML
uniref:G-protein coupled receptors family 1 profile domain-containing protein n=2 Tax=Nothobranchius furzeri TaxID=105023 RepID=A0A8C6NUB9_NOTFU